MPARRLLSLALLAGLITAASACSDVTAPQESGVCQVTGGGQTCVN